MSVASKWENSLASIVPTGLIWVTEISIITGVTVNSNELIVVNDPLIVWPVITFNVITFVSGSILIVNAAFKASKSIDGSMVNSFWIKSNDGWSISLSVASKWENSLASIVPNGLIWVTEISIISGVIVKLIEGSEVDPLLIVKFAPSLTFKLITPVTTPFVPIVLFKLNSNPAIMFSCSNSLKLKNWFKNVIAGPGDTGTNFSPNPST